MIPIYRAKKIDSDDYITGEVHTIKDRLFLRGEFLPCVIGIEEVDKTTLSIHFPDMIDSNGNKIFASLQENGKGGDILDCRIAVNCDKPTRLKTIKYTKPYRFTIGVYDIDAYARKYITGIQEWKLKKSG